MYRAMVALVSRTMPQQLEPGSLNHNSLHSPQLLHLPNYSSITALLVGCSLSGPPRPTSSMEFGLVWADYHLDGVWVGG
jgi:hypothetical protein